MNIESQSSPYLQQVEEALKMNGLSPQTISKICGPQLLFLTSEYRSAPVQVMIIGQEIGAPDKPLQEIATEGLDALVERQKHNFKEFNYDLSGRHSRSPFWRAFDQVCDTFSLPSRRAVAWTNVSKVPLCTPIGSSVSITNLSASEQMEIIRWQAELARAEIEYAKPDVIIHFTGSMSWMLKHLYQSDMQSQKLDVKFAPIDGASPATAIVSAPFLENIITVVTHHPNGGRTSAGRQRTNEDRRSALTWALNTYRNKA